MKKEQEEKAKEILAKPETWQSAATAIQDFEKYANDPELSEELRGEIKQHISRIQETLKGAQKLNPPTQQNDPFQIGKAQDMLGATLEKIGVGPALETVSELSDYLPGLVRTGVASAIKPELVKTSDVEQALYPFEKGGAVSGGQLLERGGMKETPLSSTAVGKAMGFRKPYLFEKEPLIKKPFSLATVTPIEGGALDVDLRKLLGTGIDVASDPFLLKSLFSGGLKLGKAGVRAAKDIGKKEGIRDIIPTEFLGSTAEGMRTKAAQETASQAEKSLLRRTMEGTGKVAADPFGSIFDIVKKGFERRSLGEGAGMVRPGMVPAEETLKFIGGPRARNEAIKQAIKSRNTTVAEIFSDASKQFPEAKKTLESVLTENQGWQNWLKSNGLLGDTRKIKGGEFDVADKVAQEVQESFGGLISKNKSLTPQDLFQKKQEYQKLAKQHYRAARNQTELNPTLQTKRAEAYAALASSFREAGEKLLDEVEPGLGAYASKLNAETAGLQESSKALKSTATAQPLYEEIIDEALQSAPMSIVSGGGGYAIGKGLEQLGAPKGTGWGAAAAAALGTGNTAAASLFSRLMGMAPEATKALIRSRLLEQRKETPWNILEEKRREVSPSLKEYFSEEEEKGRKK